MSFDISKPYKTRDGHSASAIRHPDAGCEHLAIGTYSNEHIRPGLWALNNGGKWAGDDNSHGGWQQPDHPLDLVNVPETRTVWLNIYSSGWSYGHSSRAHADERSGGDRVACVELTFTIGEGLEP